MNHLGLGLAKGLQKKTGTVIPPPPSGAQFPNMLNGYAKRNPDPVRGVDNRAGPSAAQTYISPLDWTPPTGASVDTGNHLIRVDGTNVTITGLDLTDNWQIFYTGTNVIVTLNKWKSFGGNTFLQCGAAANGGTITLNDLDGNKTDSTFGAFLTCNGGGSWLIQNNYMRNAFSDFINFGSVSPGTPAPTVDNNLFYNCGYGFPSAHPDNFQAFNDATYTVIYTNNTWYQDDGNLGSQGISASDPGTGTILVSFVGSGNTFNFAAAPVGEAGVHQCFGVDTTWVQTTFSVSNNYVNPTGFSDGMVTGVFITERSDGGGPYTGTVVKTGNFNMITGGSIS